ncbi:MAG: hypothetical protein ACI9MR_002119 [Myxococcota bacterium]|jgi:hypothetical protein
MRQTLMTTTVALILALAFVLVSGCATSNPLKGLTVVDERGEVRGCMIVTEIDAKDVFYERMLRKVADQANLAGATHILKLNESASSCGGANCAGFTGRGYRCNDR